MAGMVVSLVKLQELVNEGRAVGDIFENGDDELK